MASSVQLVRPDKLSKASPSKLVIINDTPYDLYVLTHKNLNWVIADLSTLLAIQVIPIVDIILFMDYLKLTEGILDVKLIIQTALILEEILKDISNILMIGYITKETLKVFSNMFTFIKPGNSKVVYSKEICAFEWLEPSVLIPEFDPYASDISVHLLAVYNGQVMGYTMFNANRNSIWIPNILAIPRQDCPDDNVRSWLTGKILKVLDTVKELIETIIWVDNMIENFITKLPWHFVEILLMLEPFIGGTIVIAERNIRLKNLQKSYLQVWKQRFSDRHEQQKAFVLQKLKGKVVTLKEENSPLLLETLSKAGSHSKETIKQQALECTNTFKSLHLQLGNIKDIYELKTKLQKYYFGSDIYNLENITFCKYPLFPDSIWPGLRLLVKIPDMIPSNLPPKEPGSVEFYKQTWIEPKYGGATLFLRGRAGEPGEHTTLPQWKGEMIHVHAPSLRMNQESGNFVEGANGEYFISYYDDPSCTGMTVLHKCANEIVNWCINVEVSFDEKGKKIPMKKYMLYTPGPISTLPARLCVYDSSGSTNVPIDVLEKYIIEFQESHKDLFKNPIHPFK